MKNLKGFDVTHENILKSGKINFLNDGYERANLRKICKDAGVTTGAFYRHFEDKEALFVALVEPLAKEILDLYTKFEEESFRSIDEKHIKDLAEINIDGSIETAIYIFRKKDIFELLVYKAYGTKYDNFIEKLVKMEDLNRNKISKIVLKNNYKYINISEKSMHLLNHAYINALCEIIMHSDNIEEVKQNSEIVARFFREGWKKLQGF
ncbi:TetR family transcriptional regulator [Finegoldia sp. BIOML-A3]|uniref:TetR/AcrR family transcriptional regulator n=1 Tax=unclassified Finegoldia TaxID=2619637 RepID=UPI0012B14DBB|nr:MULTISPECIES: TetR/AcrR family transcriptional regulator [unclassified Finegoldia]MSA99554.1 TetR family transcriptional regulator [Finegoldia sp. BIOML-A3]MSB10446.1 TetR family transcriptional regulator [Finegoldia sp. BIOML-A1]MSB92068.1 TetR family transcriptional regulator [Finegoldia sp. BIOML-A4]